MKEYKGKLDNLNSLALQMFNHAQEISELINSKVVTLEKQTQLSEKNFTDELSKLNSLNE